MRPLFWHHPWPAMMALLLVIGACSGSESSDQSTTSTQLQATTTTTLPTATTSGGTTAGTATSSTTTSTVPGFFEWPGDPPQQYALIRDQVAQLVDGGSKIELDIGGISTGALVDGKLVFALEGVNGTWVWPAPPDFQGATTGGPTPAGLMIAQGSVIESTTRFHDVAVLAGRPTVIYSEIETEISPQKERLMLWDLEADEPKLLFDKFDRRGGLLGEEATAILADVAHVGDRLAVLFTLEDRTWLEWYDVAGNPLVEAPTPISVAGTALELAAAGDVLVVGAGIDADRLVTEFSAINVETGSTAGVWSSGVADEFLRNLDCDGRWISAAVYTPEGRRRGALIVDVQSGVATVVDVPASIVFLRS